MIDQIISAINDRRTLALTYKTARRVVEPYAVGKTAEGKAILRCYQIQGEHTERGHDWDLLTVSKITGLVVNDQVFAPTRSGYKRGDKAMATIFAQI